MFLILCKFLQSHYQPTNALNKIKFVTGIEFLHVSATGCHPQTRDMKAHSYYGDCSGTAVKVLCYKSEGRWFDPSWCDWNFSLT